MSDTIAQLKQDNAKFLFHPMAHPRAMQQTQPHIIARGAGSWIWDVDGHKMVDGVGGLWSANLGFSRKEIRDAVVAQLDELPFYVPPADAPEMKYLHQRRQALGRSQF